MERPPIKCDFCNLHVANSEEEHEKHLAELHPSFWNCQVCDFSTSSGRYLKVHMKAVHDKIKDFNCPHCDFKASHQSTITKHVKYVHDKIQEHKCPQCDLRFSSKYNICSHIDSIHEKSGTTNAISVIILQPKKDN
jgi:rubrerythrin